MDITLRKDTGFEEIRAGDASCTSTPGAPPLGSMWDCCCSPCRLNYKIGSDSVGPELSQGQDLLSSAEGICQDDIQQWHEDGPAVEKMNILRVSIPSNDKPIQAIPIDPQTADSHPPKLMNAQSSKTVTLYGSEYEKTETSAKAESIRASISTRNSSKSRDLNYAMSRESSIKTKKARSHTTIGFGGVTMQDAEDAESSVVIVRHAKPSRIGPIRRTMQKLLLSRPYVVLSLVCLVVALFGGSLFLIFAVPDDPGVVLQDVIMMVVLLFFAGEMIMKTIVEQWKYVTSFFALMDLLGTFSMFFEISFLLGTTGQLDTRDESMNTVLLRAARASKVGARAGRFSKIVKVFNFIHRRKDVVKHPSYAENEARELNAKLMTTLSSKVAILTISLVVGVPLLNIGRYPADDNSLRTWARSVEVEYTQIWSAFASNNLDSDSSRFLPTCTALKQFYEDLWYRPFKLEGYSNTVMINSISRSIPGEEVFSDKEEPGRKDFITKQEVSRCRETRPECTYPTGDVKAAIYFDFQASKQFEAIMDMAMIVFVILVMILESADLSSTLNRMVVAPVERMLGTVRMMAKVLQLTQPRFHEIQESVRGQPITEEDLEEVAVKARSPGVSELELLELVFNKLAKLTAVFMQSSIVDEAEMTSLDYESKGVLMEIMAMEHSNTAVSAVFDDFHKSGEHIPVVDDLQLEPALIESWQLDLLSLQRDVQHQVMTYIVFDSYVGTSTGYVWIDPDTFSGFLQAVRVGYNAPPYHNFMHACDVLATVFRMMLMLKSIEWMTDVDSCALLIAALCHDMGHFGKTNVFLTETGHELALRYNDKSPLENMHCSRLFEIVKEPMLNVFQRFNKDAYKQARKVCIATILHTDNALHFDMVKEVKAAYETKAQITDEQSRSGAELRPEYVQELQKDSMLWLKLVLHLADIATPLKPFWISRQWATRVVDEFFAQGDEEKKLGIPVGMLNDRDKVNRLGSEHGFINFLVAPLILPSIGMFPALHPLGLQMVENMESWKKLWVEGGGPTEDDVRKRDDDIAKINEKLEELRIRKPAVGTGHHVPKSKTGMTASPSPR